MLDSSCFQCVMRCAAPLCLLLCAQTVSGADIAYEVRQGRDTSLSLELGIQLFTTKLPLVGWANDDPDDPTSSIAGINILLDGRAEWRGLFIETLSESFSGWALGYSPWENEHSSVDLVLTAGLGAYEPGIGDFTSVKTRDTDLVAGVRSAHNFDDILFQFEIYSDISGAHDGQTTALQVGKFWQLRNWNLHGVAGIRYYSDRMLDYYFGISEEESTARIPRYQAGDGTLATLEIGATIPLNEKWIFKSTAQGFYLPDSVFDSPLANNRLGSMLTTSISYVF